jgi:hypothetical protein
MKKLISLFSICFALLASQTVMAQLKEDYVGITWKFSKMEASNPQDTGLMKGIQGKQLSYKGSTLVFSADDTFKWIQPANGLTNEGTFEIDAQNEDFIILKHTPFESRYKLTMRNYNKELLLVDYYGQKSITFVFTR